MKKKTKWIFPVVSILVIALIALLPRFLQKSKDSEGSGIGVLTAKVEKGTIETNLSGTGTLTPEDSVDIEVPSGVKLTRYLVANGDTVVKGQPLVYVDRLSVAQAISDCQETIDYIDSEIFAEEYNTAARYLTVPAVGVASAVYAQKGDRVEDVMMEHGCLASVTINGKEWKFEAITGTVVDVCFKVGDVLYPGTTHIFLTDVDESSAYDTFLAERQEYEKMLQTLTGIYVNGVISAPCDGLISGIDDDAAEKLNREYYAEHPDEAPVEEEEPEEEETGTFGFGPGGMPQGGFPEGMTPPEGMEFPEGMTPPEGMEFPEGMEVPSGFPGASSGSDSDSSAAIQAEPAACTSAETGSTANGKKIIRVTSLVYSGEKVDTLVAEQTASGDNNQTIYEETYTTVQNGSVSIGDKTFPVDQVGISKDSVKDGDIVVGTATYEEKEEGRTCTGFVVSLVIPQQQQQKGSGMGDMDLDDLKKMMSGMSGGGGGSSSSSSDEETFEQYSLETTVVMSVTPQDTISISITIDELDVLSVSLGQEARVTIDAVPGKEYIGTVTEINTSGTSNSGGNSKYTAVVTMDRTENLIDGMNASTLITIRTTDNVLTLPVEALYEEQGRTIVYTGYDKELKNLLNPVEVETGVSDGQKVEIASGLKEGDTVYYEYTDEIVLDSSGSSGGSLSSLFGGMGGGMGGSGNRPGGGPSGMGGR